MLLLMDVPAVGNMFSAREQDTIADMALFSAIYYGQQVVFSSSRYI